MAHGGDGGCTAVALTTLGVWPSDVEAAVALDAQIAPLHEKWLRERGSCDESEAGIRDEQWHEEAIWNAIIAAGWHVKRLALDPTKADRLKTELAHGRYLVFGVTNNRWCKRVKGTVRLQPLKYPDWSADAPRLSSVDWHHSVAIVDGQLRDHATTMPLTSEHPLWLRADNQPDRDKGWLRSIRKVWRIYPCTRPGSSCRGGCARKRAQEPAAKPVAVPIAAPAAPAAATANKKQRQSEAAGSSASHAAVHIGFAEGDSVQGKWADNGPGGRGAQLNNWYAAKVITIHADGTLALEYEDGDEARAAPAKFVRFAQI